MTGLPFGQAALATGFTVLLAVYLLLIWAAGARE